jgi:dihydroorotase-like cyclic amidohydrolase
MSTLIRDGTVVNHDHSACADVLIDGGRIVAKAAQGGSQRWRRLSRSLN